VHSRTMKLIALAVVLGACGASQPNVASVAAVPPVHARVGCIDVAVEATARLPSPTLTYHFANACDHEATMNLERLAAVAVFPGGDWQRLAAAGHPYDKSSYRIDPHEGAVAERTYRGGGLADAAQICVDLGTADDAIAYAPHWTCVR
jgi:hypothetical protein